MKAACALLMLVPLCAYPQTNDPKKIDFSALRREISVRMGQEDVPGLSVAVARDGTIIWQEGFGWADIEKRIHATANTPFYTASVTKSITATAVMQLKEHGKIVLDRPVNDYLGAAKVHSPQWNAEEATVRRMMTHTSGLTTFSHWCRPGESNCNVSDEVADYGILVWPPGQVFDYSNLGYGILGEVIAHASGESYPTYIHNEVFRPLKMEYCRFSASTSAAQYDQSTHERSSVKITGHPGASGVYCSAHDLLLFGIAHLGGNGARRLHVENDLTEMHSAQPATRGQYGLGWWVREQSGYQIISAQGGTTDAYASLTLVPKKDIAVVVLANSYSQFTSDLTAKILSLLVPDLSAKVSENSSPAPAAKRPLGDLVGKWSGQMITKRGQLPVSLEVQSDGSVVGQIGSQPMASLSHVSIRPTHLYGQLPGTAELPDVPGNPYIIELDLGLYDNALMGAATAGPLPGRDGNQFPHWVKLTRAD